MNLTRDNVRDRVIECLHEISTEDISKEDITSPMNEQTNPMLKLGLDSHDGVNLACKLSEKLDYDIPEEINPLVDDQRKRPRSVGEITDLIMKLLKSRKEQTHD